MGLLKITPGMHEVYVPCTQICVFHRALCLCPLVFQKFPVSIHPAAWENPHFSVVSPGGAAHREGGGRGGWVGGLFKYLRSYWLL